MRINLDLDKMSMNTGIPVEELEKKSFKALVKIQDKIAKQEEKIKIKQRLNDPKYNLYVENLWTPYQIMRNLGHSKKEIIKVCAKYLSFGDIAQECVMRGDHDHCYYSKAVFKVKETRRMKKLHGPGSRSGATEMVYCTVYDVPNQYQGCRNGAIIKDLILKKHPWLKEYDINVYDVKTITDDIYVHINGQSLYVPIESIYTGNATAILHRHLDYHKSYYFNKLEEYQKQIDFIKSPEVTEFFARISAAKNLNFQEIGYEN